MLAEKSQFLQKKQKSKWITRLEEQVNITAKFFSSFLLSLIVKWPNRLMPHYVNGVWSSPWSLSNGNLAIFCYLSFPLKYLHVTHWRTKPRLTDFALTIQRLEFWISPNVIPFPACPVYLWRHDPMGFITWFLFWNIFGC